MYSFCPGILRHPAKPHGTDNVNNEVAPAHPTPSRDTSTRQTHMHHNGGRRSRTRSSDSHSKPLGAQPTSESYDRFMEAMEELCALMACLSLRDPPAHNQDQMKRRSAGETGSRSRRRVSTSSVSSSASTSSVETLVEDDLSYLMRSLSLHSPKSFAKHAVAVEVEEEPRECEQTEWWDEHAFLRDDSTSTPKGTENVSVLYSLQLDDFWSETDGERSSHPDDDTTWSSRSAANAGSESGDTAVDHPAETSPVHKASCALLLSGSSGAVSEGLGSSTYFVGIRKSWHVGPQQNSLSLFAPAFLSWAASGEA